MSRAYSSSPASSAAPTPLLRRSGHDVDALDVAGAAGELPRARHPLGEHEPRHAGDAPVDLDEERHMGGEVVHHPVGEEVEEHPAFWRGLGALLGPPLPPQAGQGGRVLGRPPAHVDQHAPSLPTPGAG